MEDSKKIAVLISNAGTGTNLQAIIDAIRSKKLNAIITLVISATIDAAGLAKAKKYDIPSYVLEPKENLPVLLTQKFPVDYIVLAGWKKIIPTQLIEKFPNRILNLHPGLIPDEITGMIKTPDGSAGLWNRGKFTEKAIESFIAEHATYAGSTIHFLTQQFDFGPVLGRCFEKVQPTDTVESLYVRLKRKENQLYVEVLEKLCQQ